MQLLRTAAVNHNFGVIQRSQVGQSLSSVASVDPLTIFPVSANSFYAEASGARRTTYHGAYSDTTLCTNGQDVLQWVSQGTFAGGLNPRGDAPASKDLSWSSGGYVSTFASFPIAMSLLRGAATANPITFAGAFTVIALVKSYTAGDAVIPFGKASSESYFLCSAGSASIQDTDPTTATVGVTVPTASNVLMAWWRSALGVAPKFAATGLTTATLNSVLNTITVDQLGGGDLIGYTAGNLAAIGCVDADVHTSLPGVAQYLGTTLTL